MAQSKSFFGLRKGSTGALTFQIRDGKQVTMQRLEHIKNPRTLGQMRQRMIITTASQALHGLKDIVDHSWEGVKFGAKSTGKFMSVNSKLLRDNWLENGNKVFGYNKYQEKNKWEGEYIVSQGSLGTIDKKYIDNDEILEESVILYIFGDPKRIDRDVTIQQFAEKWGLTIGSSILILCYSIDVTGKNLLAWLRMTLKNIDGSTISDSHFVHENFDLESNVSYSIDNYDEEYFEVYLEWPPLGNGTNCYYTCIVSTPNSDDWLRSNSQFMQGRIKRETTTAEEALATYPVKDRLVLNSQ